MKHFISNLSVVETILPARCISIIYIKVHIFWMGMIPIGDPQFNHHACDHAYKHDKIKKFISVIDTY